MFLTRERHDQPSWQPLTSRINHCRGRSLFVFQQCHNTECKPLRVKKGQTHRSGQKEKPAWGLQIFWMKLVDLDAFSWSTSCCYPSQAFWWPVRIYSITSQQESRRITAPSPTWRPLWTFPHLRKMSSRSWEPSFLRLSLSFPNAAGLFSPSGIWAAQTTVSLQVWIWLKLRQRAARMDGPTRGRSLSPQSCLRCVSWLIRLSVTL